jgi:hypothetical protein
MNKRPWGGQKGAGRDAKENKELRLRVLLCGFFAIVAAWTRGVESCFDLAF